MTLSGGSTAVCGTFPHPLASNQLARQYVTASAGTTPGTASLTTVSGSVTTIDHATANLGNFDTGTTIATTIGAGYGSTVGFTSGARTSLGFAQHISATSAGGQALFDHSVFTNTPLTINETAGSSSRTIAGTVTLYHNLLKVVATSTVSLVHQDGCCLPISGTVSTSFAAGARVSPTTAGASYVGKTETMTFTGCGTASFTDVTGAVSNVTLTRCM